MSAVEGPSLHCRFNHHMCRTCANRFVAETWMARPVDPGVVPEVDCCNAGCGIVMREHQLAAVLDERTFQAYLERRTAARDGLVLARMREEIADMDPSELKSRAAADRAVLAKQLQKQLPEALQCPQCGHGPIDFSNCENLSTHHGQVGANGAVIRNTCPQCGFFAASRSGWRKWDGVLRAPKKGLGASIGQRCGGTCLFVAGLVVLYRDKWTFLYALIAGIGASIFVALAEQKRKEDALAKQRTA